MLMTQQKWDLDGPTARKEFEKALACVLRDLDALQPCTDKSRFSIVSQMHILHMEMLPYHHRDIGN